MANIPRRIPWGFNPNESDLDALKNPQDRTLWAVLRFGHIVSQHFNQNVADLAHNLRINPPPDAHQLYARAGIFGIHGHGVMQDRVTRQMGMDPEWWGDLLEAWRGNLVIDHEWPGKVSAHRRPVHGGYPASAAAGVQTPDGGQR